ncbi:MAG: hypothetical protein QOI66_1631, partial [Myxococcales bacterium]|nr:hypothetical protein [Myxococcales bacterium]
MAQDKQAPVQTSLQQTPSTQNPLRQSSLAAQETPSVLR